MSNRTVVANGEDAVQQKAAGDANAIQNGVNIVAIVGCFHEWHLDVANSLRHFTF